MPDSAFYLPRVAYLFSRFPVVSQTFCDTEMLGLEAAGFHLAVASFNPPPNSFRHERLGRLRAEVIYPPPKPVLEQVLKSPPDDPVWRAMETLAADHSARYGPQFHPSQRARLAWWFAGELRRRGIRHVHIHFANRATLTALYLKEAGITFSFTAHAQDFMIDLGSDDLLREMIRGAAFTVAVSDFSRNLLVRICPDAEDRIHRVYNGIDAPQFPQASPSPDGRFKIVSVGRLIDFKGFPVLLEAVAGLKARGIGFELVIVGEGPQRPLLEEKIGALGLEDSVRLAGVRSQEEIKRELATASVFALACLTDGKGAMDILPTVILEAMACRLPVVSTTLAGVPEMVAHGVTGLLAVPQDARGMEAHLAALALDPALRGRLGAEGYRRVREIFALDRTVGHLGRLMRPWLKEEEAVPLPEGDLLCLLDTGTPADALLEKELRHLSALPSVTVMATRQGMAPAGCEYLPDATVIESHWRSRPDLVARVEALRAELGSLEGDAFYEAARRAVYLAVQLSIRGWRRIHALRASGAVIAWMLHRLTRLPVGVVIEAGHSESRTVLRNVVGVFTWGSNSDVRLETPLLPDLLKLRSGPLPPPWRRLWKFRQKPQPPVSAVSVWESWLRMASEAPAEPSGEGTSAGSAG
ncbi:MAG: colanic acid biosynthesis glycosyltransferase WcaL [Verrucomicrobiales bacterium]|nr:colanic acid biosynthesis glycosyltransferase WcaL [Verrucomicrobiales bacterium]